MDKITHTAIRAYNYYELRKADLYNALRRLREEERGDSGIPWMLILMVGGAIIAIGLLTWAVIWVKNQLSQVGNAPTF